MLSEYFNDVIVYVRIFLVTVFLTATISLSGQDPLDIVWQEEQQMPLAYAYHNSLALGQSIYLVGGDQKVISAFSTNTGKWTSQNQLEEECFFPSSGIFGSGIVLVGGISPRSGAYSSDCRRHNLASGIWTAGHPAPYAFSRAAATFHNDTLIITGGLVGDSDRIATNTRSIIGYDAARNTWHTISRMTTARHGHGVAIFHDKLYLFGGYTEGGPVGSLEIYDMRKAEWSSGSAMSAPRGFFGYAMYDRFIITVGGRTRENVAPVEVYDTSTDTWHLLPGIPGTRQRFGLSIVGNRIFMTGGEERPGNMMIGEIFLK